MLRVIPIPGINFNYNKADTLTGSGFYPNSICYYRNDRGEFVKRKVNKWGYFDSNYTKEKDSGVYRIGFFGDSYTQAISVPLDETFHSLIGSNLEDRKIETLSFGVSGYSTYQSYLNSKRWSYFFDLDLIVYVFCENDIGDQIPQIRRVNAPYPILKNGKIVTDESYLQDNHYRFKSYYKFADYLTSRSLVLATISTRIRLLKDYGIKLRVTDQDREMQSNNQVIGPVTQGDNPSRWDDSVRQYAIELECKILQKWQQDAEESSRDFAILYVPRILEMSKATTDQDSWKPYLLESCGVDNIGFIDPTNTLLEYTDRNLEIHYDHFNKYGHAAVAESFLNWFNEYFE